MTRYRALALTAAEALEAAFQRHFSDWEDPEPGELPTELPPEA
jgi:hypothetical protein